MLQGDASISVAMFANRIFEETHQLIIAQEAGAIRGDVEAVHDMRVAIRRLRVALSNFAFCLPRQDRRRLLDQLEHLADALGGVRDFDVLIESLEHARQTRPATDHPAINSSIRRLRARRRRQFHRLAKYLGSDEYGNFKHEFSSNSKAGGEEIQTKAPQPKNKLKHGQAA